MIREINGIEVSFTDEKKGNVIEISYSFMHNGKKYSNYVRVTKDNLSEGDLEEHRMVLLDNAEKSILNL